MKSNQKRWTAVFQLSLIIISLAHTHVWAQNQKVIDGLNSPTRVLYNGIELPETWPPKDGNPFTYDPMHVPYLEHVPKTIPIDIGRQLFVDDFLIEKTNLIRVFHQAKKYEGNPVMKPASLRQGGVFYDPVEERFNMYYNDGSRGVGLSVSRDLKHWTRPDGSGREDESRLIVLPERGANSFWLHMENSSSRKFFAMRADKMNPRPKNDPDVPYVNAIWQNMWRTSDDGVNWSAAIPLGRSNDYSSFFYNPFRKVWVFSLKANVRRFGKEVYRSRYYVERINVSGSSGFEDAVFWVNADKLDRPHPSVGDTAQLYTLHGIAYESILLGAFQIHLGPANEISDKKMSRNLPKSS